MSFTKYLREMEDLEISKIEMEKNSKLVDFIKTIDDLNSEAFVNFAINDLGMTPEEADTVVFKMLKSFLLTNDKDGNGIPDDLQFDDGEGDELDSDIEDFDDDLDINL